VDVFNNPSLKSELDDGLKSELDDSFQQIASSEKERWLPPLLKVKSDSMDPAWIRSVRSAGRSWAFKKLVYGGWRVWSLEVGCSDELLVA
jgi:hypothetical protein